MKTTVETHLPARGPGAAAPPPPRPPDVRPKFPKDEAGFQAELRRRVDAHFAATGRSEAGGWRLVLKTAVILAWLAAAYLVLVFVADAWWQAVPVAVLLALAMAAVGFNIQHDGGHGAFSKSGWVNKLAATSLDLIGGSSYLWHWQHGVFHHTFTNIAGQDSDIDVGDAVRLSPHQPRLRVHRWQHLYIWALYGVMAVRWQLIGDLQGVISGRVGAHRVPRPKGRDLAVFVVGKVASAGLLLALPLVWHPWWVVLLFYVLVMGVLGVTLSVVFQLAHCVEEAAFPLPEPGTTRMRQPWAVHQVHTTVDFARDSRLLAWLLGGLNFQVEHHLFPRVSHVHYPALSRIVERTCHEYGVRYMVHRTLWAGLGSHYRWLRRMGLQSAG